MSSATERHIRPELLIALDGGKHRHVIEWHGQNMRPAGSAVCRIRQPELRGGIRERAHLRDEWIESGRNAVDLIVALEIDVLIAAEAALARAELRCRGESQSGETVRYVGTVNGLVSLIRDVYIAEVADAVILCPLDYVLGVRSASAELILSEVLPLARDSFSMSTLLGEENGSC